MKRSDMRVRVISNQATYSHDLKEAEAVEPGVDEWRRCVEGTSASRLSRKSRWAEDLQSPYRLRQVYSSLITVVVTH